MLVSPNEVSSTTACCELSSQKHYILAADIKKIFEMLCLQCKQVQQVVVASVLLSHLAKTEILNGNGPFRGLKPKDNAICILFSDKSSWEAPNQNTVPSVGDKAV